MPGLSNSLDRAAVTQLGYVGLGVSNLAAWEVFATEVLGLQVNGPTADGGIFLRMDSYHHRYILLPTGEDDVIFHGWEVKDAEALSRIATQIRAHGLDVVEGSVAEAADRKVLGLIRFVDPDGLRTEIYYGAQVDHRPFVSPRGIHGFAADQLGMGHIVLRVQDPKAYVSFWTDVLGARLSDFIQIPWGAETFELTFMHVNPRHHSLAISQMKPGLKRLDHVMLEVRSVDEVGLTHSLFEKSGIAVGGFGRHTNDQMFSFYGETPSGFLIEYGVDGIQIHDEARWEVGYHVAGSIWGHGRPKIAAAG